MLSVRCPFVCPVCLSVTLVYCDQTAGWIKMPIGVEVGLGPGHNALDGDPAHLPKKGAQLPFPIFGPCPLWPNCWMDQDATWYDCTEVGLGPCHHVLHGDPAPPPKRGHSLPIFGPCLLWSNGRPSQLLLSTCNITR